MQSNEQRTNERNKTVNRNQLIWMPVWSGVDEAVRKCKTLSWTHFMHKHLQPPTYCCAFSLARIFIAASAGLFQSFKFCSYLWMHTCATETRWGKEGWGGLVIWSVLNRMSSWLLTERWTLSNWAMAAACVCVPLIICVLSEANGRWKSFFDVGDDHHSSSDEFERFIYSLPKIVANVYWRLHRYRRIVIGCSSRSQSR